MTVEQIKKEQTYARMWSEKTHHPEDHEKIAVLLKEVERLRKVVEYYQDMVDWTNGGVDEDECGA